MLPISSETISENTQNHLTNKQNIINELPTFLDKKNRAGKLWDSKNGSIGGHAAFQEIKTKLETMTVGKVVCNYCEHNEAIDIEHIKPKGFFPQSTFVWENYILACKACNTDNKLDNFAVFLPDGEVHQLNASNRGIEPLSTDITFINPRIDNPTDYFSLDLLSAIFIIPQNLDARSKRKQIKPFQFLN